MVKKKSRHIGLWIVCVCFVMLGILFFTMSYSVANETPRALEYNRSRLSEGVTFATYEKMPQVSFTDNLALCGELNTETVDRIGEVKPSLVNEHFFDVYDIHVRGSGITEDHVVNKTSAIVISDNAARKMSLDGNVVGQTISLFGKDFTIVGVYHKPDGFLRGISSDIFDRAYIPYTCYEGYGKQPLDTVAAKKGSYSEKALPLLGMMSSDSGYYLENDLDIKHDMISNLPNLFVGFIAIILTVVVIRVIIKMGKGAAKRLRETRKTEYFTGVLRRNWLYLLSRVLIAAALIAVPVMLFIFFPPKLVIPQNYIPYDNIFELNHYLDVFTSHIQQANSNLAMGNCYYQHLFGNAMLMLVPMLLLLMTLSLVITVRISKLVKNRRGWLKTLIIPEKA